MFLRKKHFGQFGLHYFCLFFSRSKDIVEPILKEQWYLSCKDMAQKAVQVCNIECEDIHSVASVREHKCSIYLFSS